MAFSTQDLIIVGIIALLGGAYLFFGNSKKAAPQAAAAFANGASKAGADDGGSTGRDFVAAMEKAVSGFDPSGGGEIGRAHV